MAGEGNHGVFDGGVSRARFLKLAGLGAGLSLFPGSLLSANVAGAQAVGTTPELLDPTRYPYPIVAWWPPPPVSNNLSDEQVNEETARRYAELAGAGFNTAIGGNGVGNERANRLALDACERPDVDVRLVLADADLSNAIEGPATDVNRAAITQRLNNIYFGIQGRTGFGGRTGLGGIFLYDEPGKTKFANLRFARKQVEDIFGPDELPYVNAWPSYATLSALQASSYTDYLAAYMNGDDSESSPFLSFDHYPLLDDEKTTPDFFYNHAVIRRYAQTFGVPSWGFVQSMGFTGGKVGIERRRPPDEAEIFWQINVALAYGVKGIQYFTYWTPNDPNLQTGGALITLDGERTPRYDYATRANEFLRKVGRILLPLTSESVNHFGEKRLPLGAKPFKGYPSYVKAASGSAAILGLFKGSDASTERYLLVVNRSPNKAATTRLTIPGTVGNVKEFDPSVEAPGDPFVPPQSLAGNPRILTVTLKPGRAILYRLRTA